MYALAKLGVLDDEEEGGVGLMGTIASPAQRNTYALMRMVGVRLLKVVAVLHA